MINDSAANILSGSFLVAFLLCANVVCAQQQAYETGAAGYPSTTGAYSSSVDSGSSNSEPAQTGLYPSAISGLANQSASSLANAASPANAASESAKNPRANAAASAWNRSRSNTKESVAAAWLAGADSFKAASSASWGAGLENFGLRPQAGGIWRALPAMGPAPSGDASLQSPSSAATATSPANDLNGISSGASYGLSSRRGSGSSPRGFGSGLSGTPGGKRGTRKSSGSRNRGSGGFGSVSGSSSTQHAPKSGSQPAAPSLNDDLNLKGIGALDSGGLGSEDNADDTSH